MHNQITDLTDLDKSILRECSEMASTIRLLSLSLNVSEDDIKSSIGKLFRSELINTVPSDAPSTVFYLTTTKGMNFI